MANGSSGGFPIGKLVSLAVVVGLLFFPVISCGPIEFMGHEIARNKTPDMDEFEGALKEGLGGMGSASGGTAAGGNTGGVKTSMKKDRDHLFEGGEAWMQWLFILVLVLALATALPVAGRVRALLAVAGLVGLIVFLERFEGAISGDKEAPSGLEMLEWDAGAYIGVIGFALLIVESYLQGRAGGGTRAATPD